MGGCPDEFWTAGLFIWDILRCCICAMLFGIADGMLICVAIELETFIWFCCRGDCGIGLCILPSVFACPIRGEVCDISGIEYAGYPEAAAVAIAAACEGETPYCDCMPYGPAP